ncbi:conserved hypothetical protein [Hyphomicrobiales bacterium]|nr:conserved hypothetical protein [Hyphomicrobiales bacterium]CAH1696475.1 conserved hypothetical protein [Hyphomicrobiales bacterium]
MRQVEHQPYHPRAIHGEVLDFAARLETHHPHFLLKQLYATDLARQAFFCVAAEIDLDQPSGFLQQIHQHAPAVFAESSHLDPLAQIARALIQMKPRKLLEVIFGCCPDGLTGLLARVGPTPFYRKDLYRTAFELCAKPQNRQRLKALGQLQGLVRPEQILMASELDDVLVHRAVLERAKPLEVTALNAFARMLPALCNASDKDVRDSLDQLPSNVRGVTIGQWCQSWLKQQVRLPVPVPIPDNDPDLQVRIGADQESLGRRFRNCAGSLLSFAFTGERVLVEWVREGEEAVIDLALVRTGSEYRWQCENLSRPRNRRVSAMVARAIRERFDELGILYRFNPMPSDEQQGIAALLDHSLNATFVDQHALANADDEHVERLLDALEVELEDTF